MLPSESEFNRFGAFSMDLINLTRVQYFAKELAPRSSLSPAREKNAITERDMWPAGAASYPGVADREGHSRAQPLCCCC
jgi:hypothetical protein